MILGELWKPFPHNSRWEPTQSKVISAELRLIEAQLILVDSTPRIAMRADCDEVKVAMPTTEWEKICVGEYEWVVYVRCVIQWGLGPVFDIICPARCWPMVRVVRWLICYFGFVAQTNESVAAVLWDFEYIGLDLMPWGEGRTRGRRGLH